MLAEQDRAQIAMLEEELETAQEQAAGRSAPPCRSCGGELGARVCPWQQLGR